jgi:hypothetical protein
MVNYLNPAIKSHVKNVFNLTDDDYYILGEFAKMGETYRNRINLANLSDRQVSRRVDVLFKNNFLTLIKSTPYRNIKGKKTRIFGLTFKGFLASLYHINLEDIYLFKTYQKLIGTEISPDAISFYVKYVKYFLIYFLFSNKIMGIKFDDMPNVANWFDVNFDVTHISNRDIKSLKKLKNNVDESYAIINMAYIYYYEEQMPTWYNLRNYWHHVIGKIAEGKKTSKILSELRKEYSSEFENEVNRRKLKRDEYYRKQNKKVQLATDKLLRRRKKPTKYTN